MFLNIYIIYYIYCIFNRTFFRKNLCHLFFLVVIHIRMVVIRMKQVVAYIKQVVSYIRLVVAYIKQVVANIRLVAKRIRPIMVLEQLVIRRTRLMAIIRRTRLMAIIRIRPIRPTLKVGVLVIFQLPNIRLFP